MAGSNTTEFIYLPQVDEIKFARCYWPIRCHKVSENSGGTMEGRIGNTQYFSLKWDCLVHQPYSGPRLACIK